MHVGNARLNTRRLSAARAGYSCGLALLVFLFGSKALQNAVAEGDTRTISLHHMHTDEDITITFKRDGRYDDAALEKLNWFLRDWRRSEQTNMDPHLIDLVWEVQREAGTKAADPGRLRLPLAGDQRHASPPQLRASRAFSQHMLGHAMDFYIAGVPLEKLREIGLRLQRGGVGFYPTSGSPFVHMDTAGIRMWPRMSHEELARVFPDGRTVHIPTDGQPLSGYALALADIKKRGSDALREFDRCGAHCRRRRRIRSWPATTARHAIPSPSFSVSAKDEDDEDEDDDAACRSRSAAPASPPRNTRSLPRSRTAPQAAGKATVELPPDKVAAAASKAKLIRTADAAPMQTSSPRQGRYREHQPKLIHVARGRLPAAARDGSETSRIAAWQAGCRDCRTRSSPRAATAQGPADAPCPPERRQRQWAGRQRRHDRSRLAGVSPILRERRNGGADRRSPMRIRVRAAADRHRRAARRRPSRPSRRRIGTTVAVKRAAQSGLLRRHDGERILGHRDQGRPAL